MYLKLLQHLSRRDWAYIERELWRGVGGVLQNKALKGALVEGFRTFMSPSYMPPSLVGLWTLTSSFPVGDSEPPSIR